ncbi:uncharacterized protein [Diabrotica undecimpunctata]|uniref:uncharacterized protein n=1 Tax=Diabrotica undecimpunctata TaxID=50387 RepID=UPI003B638E59
MQANITPSLHESKTSVANPSIQSTHYVSLQTLLSTALINIYDSKNIHTCRALLDSGSQSHFISEQLCKKLGITFSDVNYAVKGLGQSLSNINKQVNEVMSCINNFKMNITCLVLPVITEKLPLVSFNKKHLQIPSHLKLADPQFNQSSQIDILLGSNVFWQLLAVGQIKLRPNMPTLQKTQLGWIIAGDLLLSRGRSNSTVNYFSIKNASEVTDDSVTRFWNIKEIHDVNKLTQTEQYCEDHFKSTTKRHVRGRFILNTPFNQQISKLRESKQTSINRFFSLERKLLTNSELRREYVNFMSEYELLGHMTEVKENKGDTIYFFTSSCCNQQ